MGWCVLGGVVLFTLLSLVPWTLRFAVRSSPSWHGNLRVAWGGVLHWQREFPSAGSSDSGTRASRRQTRDRKRRKSSPAISDIVATVRHVAVYLGRFVAQTRIEQLTVDCRAGLEDPADTGMLCGLVAPLVASFGVNHRGSVGFQPEFSGECFELNGHGKAVFIPFHYLAVVSAFLLNPQTWRLGLRLIRE